MVFLQCDVESAQEHLVKEIQEGELQSTQAQLRKDERLTSGVNRERSSMTKGNDAMT